MPTDDQIIKSMAEYIAGLDCRDCPVYSECNNDVDAEEECQEKIIIFFER